MKIAFFSTKSYDREYFEKANLDKKHELSFFESSLKESSVKLAEGHDAVCVFVNDKLNASVIQALNNFGVKLVTLRCAGFNNVDIQECARNGIIVLRVPAYSPHAVAEHAVALILTLNRKTHKAYNRVREGNFSLERLIGFDLYGKTVGVIGTGKIGAIFAKLMLGFGCKVMAFDKFPNDELKTLGIEYSNLDALFKNSDIISLHCPLTPETNHLINKNNISIMKQGVMLINTSRGKLVDTNDAIEALKTGQIGYLGIDVYEQEEKLFFKDLSEIIITDDRIARLMSFPNVLVTAHQAFFTDNALSQIASTTLQNIEGFMIGSWAKENEVTINMVK
jgi:D-lactate dehydrogenase